MQKSILLVCLLVFSVQAATSPSCLNPSGVPVDWFVAFKLPGGTYYGYCDSIQCTSIASTGKQLNNFPESPVLRTLQQISNTQSKTVGSLFWNDQPPNSKASSTVAHAKGFMGFTQNSGFLMVHSTPLFPEVNNDEVNLVINDGQTKYGQHFYCVTTTTDDLESIAEAYTLDWPKVYAGSIPSTFTNVSFLNQMLSNTRNTSKNQLQVVFNSLAGKVFNKFGKSGKWVVPFYENVPSQALKIHLIVESWGSPQEEATCSGAYHVMSNLSVSLGSTSYKYTNDHSKYAISDSASQPYVCFGDINRQESQWKRGGGTVCFEDTNLYRLMRSSMILSQSCYA